MRSTRLDRVYRQALSSVHMLARCQAEAEALVDQKLAEDLQVVTVMLSQIVKAAERNHYRSPLPRNLDQLLYVSVSR